MMHVYLTPLVQLFVASWSAIVCNTLVQASKVFHKSVQQLTGRARSHWQELDCSSKNVHLQSQQVYFFQ